MRGGRAPPPSSMDAPPKRGATYGRGAPLILSAFNIYLLAFPFLRQSIGCPTSYYIVNRSKVRFSGLITKFKKN